MIIAWVALPGDAIQTEKMKVNENSKKEIKGSCTLKKSEFETTSEQAAIKRLTLKFDLP